MTWQLNNAPAPCDPSSGWLIIEDIQYPPDWPHDDLIALGLTWIAPEPPALTAEDCLAALADMRWQRSQYFVFDGVLTQADPAIAVVNATLAMRQRRVVPAEAVQTWKLSQADFRQWDEAQIEAFGFAIADHIQGCFDREATLSGQIIVAEDPGAIDITTGWPGDV
ncbi:DUF4376 domain-containing protein [Brevundimonas naejangsanensis]|uniref:DUF4376 domain-containing protein n=1 Tax=Brevundimonas naejangsanensis TaxID=588932 RepID=UPI0026EC5E29|nr:DUF4376 domain-containing protein [Brevundimonas naejangsanensis]